MVFLFLVLLLLVVLIVMTYFSKIQIEIVNVKFCSQTKRHLNRNYEIIVRLCLGFITLAKISFNKTKLEKMKIKQKIQNIDLSKLEKMPAFDKELVKIFKKLDFEIKKIDLGINIGTESASLTAIIVPAISTIISLILRKRIKKFENQKFVICPIYQNQNLVNLSIKGIFEIKMRHIINVIYIFMKKERGVKKYERTSNRRAYDYGYE